MLHHRNKASRLAPIMALVVLAGCTSAEDEWSKASPENQGYQWRGQGDPSNFGSAYSFCRSTVGEETVGQRLEGGGGPVTTMPGGPTVIPGYQRGGQPVRATVANRRQFTDCMASQGWVTTEPEPTPRPSPF